VFKNFFKRVLHNVLDCVSNRTYVHSVKLYYLTHNELQVGVRTYNLLQHYTGLQQSKYMLGYVDNNVIDDYQLIYTHSSCVY